MPNATRPGRVLTLRIASMGGEFPNKLNILACANVRELHHQIRKLVSLRGAFDMVHQNKGAIFGVEEDFGSREYAERRRKRFIVFTSRATMLFT